MEVSSNINTVGYTQSSVSVKNVFTEKLTKEQVSDLKEQIQQSTTMYAFNSTAIQGGLSNSQTSFEQDYADFQSFLTDVGYSGKPIAELSQDEAAELVSEDGIFGVKQTSQRLADFVINGSGGDEERFRAGREGLIRGYKEAEQMWGGELPEISQQTMDKALEMVDKAMMDLGFSIIDEEV
jgi:DNA polymerase III alpha subunit (gram-positive type)